MLPDHGVTLKDGIIVDVMPRDQLPSNIDQVYDLSGHTLVPGFIDLQVNGGGGIMFNNAPTLESLKTISQAHRYFGTTGLMPTLITDSFEVMRLAIDAVEEAIAQKVPGILGIHLEGPFLSEAKKGAHDASRFCKIDEQGFKLVNGLKIGKTIVTIAPELADTNMIQRLSQSGIIVCAGHSAADYEQSCDAINAGVRGFTHLFNAMTPLQSRAPGMVGAALSNENTWFGIIADGHHMHPSAFKIAISAKQRGGAILVTDAMSTVGAKDKSFELNGETIVAHNGRCENAAGSLAGSDLDMNSAIKNAVTFAKISWQEAVRMASLYPATALGLDDTLGRIKSGYVANFALLDSQLNVTSTWINGVQNTNNRGIS